MTPLSPYRRFRRVVVRVRVSPFSVPLLFLTLWCFIVLCLSLVADKWIVALAVSPLFFAGFITLLCLWAYRKDFYG